jgi:hypothetical protein
MKTLYLLDENKPNFDFPENWTIHNAPRPLWGDWISNTWELDYIHGRHYAALNPSSADYERMCKMNDQNDAWELRYIDEETAVAAGLQYYTEKLPKYLDRIDRDNPEHINLLVQKGLQFLAES